MRFCPFSRFVGAGKGDVMALAVPEEAVMTSWGAFGGGELLDFSRKGQSGLKPLVSSRPNRDAIQAPQGPSVTRGGRDTRFARPLQALPGQWAPDPRTARAFPTQ